MHIVAQILVAAPRQLVWDYLNDPTRPPEFMDGLTRWEREGTRGGALGARFRMHVRIGGIELGELIEIVEFDPPADVAGRAVRGVDMRFRWRLREPASGQTRVEMRLTYHVAGGVAARLAASLAELVVRGQVRRSLAALKRRVELLARIGPAERRDTRAPRPRAVVPARRRAVEAAGRT